MTDSNQIPEYYVPFFPFEKKLSRLFTIKPANVLTRPGQYKLITGCENEGDAEKVYLARYTFLWIGPFHFHIHIFHRSDMDRVMHDHPWNFCTIILRNGYIEHTPHYPGCDYTEVLLPLTARWRPAKWRHRVELIDNQPAVTIMITGRKQHSWGFWEGEFFTHWKDYFKKHRC